MIVGAIWYVIFSSALFSLQGISIQGAKSISSEDLLGAVQRIVDSPSLFPSDNLLFFPSEKISKTIHTSFPEVKEATLHRDFLKRTVAVQITERNAIAMLCKEQNLCVSIDEQGIAMRKEDDRATLPLFFALVPDDLVPGERVLEPSLLLSLLDFKQDIESRNLFQEQGLSIFSFFPENPGKVLVRFSEGWDSYIDPKEDMEWQKTKLVEVLEKQILPEKRMKVEYIDVRFGDQAYVKYR